MNLVEGKHYKLMPNGCWRWLYYVSKNGYGQITVNRKSYKAHRLSYLLYYGRLTSGLEIDHLCRNRNCINPLHLEEVTKAENIKRGISPSAIHAKKTACYKGHAFSKENTYFATDGSRQCRTCRRFNYNRMYATRKKEIRLRQDKRKLKIEKLEKGG